MSEEQDNISKAVTAISEAAELLGWNIIFDSTSEDVKYIVIVAPDMADTVAEKLEK